MQKHLFLYAWIFAILILGILICLCCIVWMLLTHAPQPVFFREAQLVKEVLTHAAA